MKPKDDINRLIKKLQIKASPELDRRVHNDISEALAESESVAARPIIWKLAVAAAIIIAFGVGFFIGQRSKLTQPATYSLDAAGRTPTVSVYPAVTKSEEGFWRQKVTAAMQPRPYAQNYFNKTNLIDVYKQYLKGETL
jgi:hypothetical protein